MIELKLIKIFPQEIIAVEEVGLTTVLIDGHTKLRWQQDASPLLSFGTCGLIGQERRDAFMKKMHLIYPFYAFDTNIGHPT